MKMLVRTIALFLLPTWAMAGVQLNIQCKIKEKASKVKNEQAFELVSLSDLDQQTVSLRKNLAMDSNAIYLLSLTKGDLYMDATGDEVGADYYLSLSRLQNKTKSLQVSKIKGITQDMASLTVKEGFLQDAKYRTSRGKLKTKMPKKLVLDYKVDRKRINLTCEIL